ncbi:MAG: hypothetical protein M3416_16975 [Acidobacteriota bacterium]|nr:hypothetical protein [Acidobacteriota bacterium]
MIIESWSGYAKSGGGPPRLICTIDDRVESRHFVEVINRKTYRRTLWVTGIITSNRNRAKFEDPPTVSETEWRESEILYESGSGLPDVRTFGGTRVTKKSAGSEYIAVSIVYKNDWPFSVQQSADTRKIVFSIAVA